MKNEDKLYMDLALRIAEQSHCVRAKVGCIIVKDNNIISYGYNGTPKGMCNCCEDENGNTKSIVLHAESNAIAKSKRDLTNSKMYITLAPCFDCLKLIIQTGIKEIIYLNDYRIMDQIEKFKDIVKISKYKE